ncbi:hypothetical protein DYB32_003374 [Aphanomyces invadans]|uniref:Uncharacterized protein n=1 Tax=Aphanomyces invadans TaxID=157072 RepID=A0A3R7ABB7_9STRA|nr:hypothetical protein DYB32_003374 [Aphanomyces invadans]
MMETKPTETDATKVQQRATKHVQTATTKKHALTRTEVFNVLQELAGAAAQGTALVLLHSIPVFDVLPLTLTLGFLQQQDLEPLKKIQAIFSHDSVDVRCVALATFCRVSINCTKVLFARGLTRFPFESNEARIVAQQDVTSILTDIWKLTLQAAEVESPEVAAVAFAKEWGMHPWDRNRNDGTGCCRPRYDSSRAILAKGKTNAAYETFRSLVEALLFCTHANVPHARLVVLQQFVAVLANKSTTDLRNATLVLFTALLTQLCQDSCAAPPVLDFLHNVVLPLAPKVPSANVRVQLYWLGLKFVSSTQLPIMSWVETELLGLLTSKVILSRTYSLLTAVTTTQRERSAVETIEEITGMAQEVETVVSGSCDPLCLKISYREPDDHPEEIALCVTCCNVTNVPWSDFSIGVGVKGAVKLVDTSNNMHIRATGEVKPHGMFKSEKLFRFLRFSRAEFLFRLVVEPSSPEMPPTSMGLSNPYYIPFDAMFTLPDPTLWTAPYFQASWQR